MKAIPLVFLGALISLTAAASPDFTADSASPGNLVQNPGFEKGADGYELQGAARIGRVGGSDEFTTQGVIFPGDSRDGGSVSQTIHINQSLGKWLTFRFRGLPEDGFVVPEDALAMRIDFYSKNGTVYMDGVRRLIYREIENDRDGLTINGDFGRSGAAVWRSYSLEELVPFAEVDTVKVTVLYSNGQATNSFHSSFFIDDFSLVQRKVSLTDKVDPADTHHVAEPAQVDTSKLVSLGGRWYYDPLPGESTAFPLTVNYKNADRLFYKSDRLINPFAENMTAWLRAGYKDLQGQIVTEDRFVPDNLVLIFKDDGFLTMKAHNLPNHPTAKFPDTYGTQGYNPNYIQELDKTYRLPLEPVLDSEAKAVDKKNTGMALPMGAIGVAVNGVVFYNPFDAGMTDASNIMDRCCGHPSQDNRYHYHKYPICVNTPFADKGDAPSQVIGFAFDGLPIYGPYQSAGVMAKDSTTNPLNAFNACYDDVRGWHYHVTPGKFPYIIGGYFAKAESINFERHPQRPPGGGGMPGGPPGGPMGGQRFPPPPPGD